jgi:hypothetical protein
MSDPQKPVDPEKEKRKIKSVGRMKEIMTHYYIDAKTAGQNNKKVAWITSGGPVEPLIAMDVIPVYPENHGAMIGAAKMGVDLCEKAEEMGYASDLCSYARADIACATVDGGPIGGLPRPDMLVCCNNICGTVLKWYEVQARYFKVPLFILDTPFIHGSTPVRLTIMSVTSWTSISPFWKPTAASPSTTTAWPRWADSPSRPANSGSRCWTPRFTGRRP